VPFAFGGDVRSILQVSVVVDVPVAHQLPEKHHLVGIIFGRTIGEKQLQIVGTHRRAANEHQGKKETLSHTTSFVITTEITETLCALCVLCGQFCFHSNAGFCEAFAPTSCGFLRFSAAIELHRHFHHRVAESEVAEESVGRLVCCRSPEDDPRCAALAKPIDGGLDQLCSDALTTAFGDGREIMNEAGWTAQLLPRQRLECSEHVADDRAVLFRNEYAGIRIVEDTAEE